MSELGSWMPALLQGLQITLALAVASEALGLVLATAIAVARISPRRSVRVISGAYVDVLRSIPLLALLVFVYFGLGRVVTTLGIPEFWIAAGAIAVNESAYLGETYRSALESISRIQWDAANSLGMSRWQTLRLVIFPQAVPAGIPPTVNSLVYTIKGTSLASLISIYELTGVSSELVSETFLPMQIYFLVALIYLAITVPLAYSAKYAERIVGRRLGIRVTAEALTEPRAR
jgi:His/Glu/Gln/Arg/opine family amino acid ABC transporter permease subunit